METRTCCKLVKDKVHVKKVKDYLKIVKKPKFVCKNCGRVAKKEFNLCHPKKLKSDI